MFVLDVLFDHIQQIASNVEIIGRLVQFAQFRRLMSELGPGCVKTCPSQGRPELFSQLPSSDRSCQCNWFLHRRNRDGNSTCRSGVGVFTQPGSKADLTAPKSDFRYTPESGLNSDIAPCPKSAMSGSGFSLIGSLPGFETAMLMKRAVGVIEPSSSPR